MLQDNENQTSLKQKTCISHFKETILLKT